MGHPVSAIFPYVASIRWDRERSVNHNGFWQSESFTLRYTASCQGDFSPDSVARSFGF